MTLLLLLIIISLLVIMCYHRYPYMTSLQLNNKELRSYTYSFPCKQA